MTDILNILVGTMTGNAQLVAQEIELRLEDSGTKINIIDMDKLEPDVFQNEGDYLICTSTYGQGDVPDNARDFFNALKDQKPNLAHTRYGVIALGDRTYAETYCHGGKKFDELLSELGARRVGEVFFHDASEGTLPEEEGGEWAESWFADLTSEEVSSERTKAA
ncbi:MAG: flavodoxin domain-containing protein [Betaproteobacteria bacterium]